jgi:hypothetical protein
MPAFDFITTQEFRESLELDYAEMRACASKAAWKSVQVLAGSIVEALLVDYLVATNEPARPGKNPLAMDLVDAIALCRSEGILTARTADLSSVIRSYRNLIHPGRLIRLKEEQPTQASAMIAISLVDLIIEEVAKRRRDTFGLTAEQVLSKIERDSNCLPLLKHLLTNVGALDRERLLLKLLPDRYLALAAADEDEPFSNESAKLARLQKAYRIVYEQAAEAEKQKAAAAFVTILREADGDVVTRYRQAFFLPQDLKYIADAQKPIVKQHFLSSVAQFHSVESASAFAELALYLDKTDIQQWTDSFIRTLTTEYSSEAAKVSVQRDFILAVELMAMDLQAALKKRLKDWERHYKSKGQTEELKELVHLQKLVDDTDLPF